MDQTELFRATVKALRLRIKKENSSATNPSSSSTVSPSSPLSRPTRRPTRFASEAKEVVYTFICADVMHSGLPWFTKVGGICDRLY